MFKELRKKNATITLYEDHVIAVMAICEAIRRKKYSVPFVATIIKKNERSGCGQWVIQRYQAVIWK